MRGVSPPQGGDGGSKQSNTELPQSKMLRCSILDSPLLKAGAKSGCAAGSNEQLHKLPIYTPLPYNII